VAPDRQQLGVVEVCRLAALEVAYTPEEERVHRLLREYSRSSQQGADDAAERVATESILNLLKKRLLSSPESFAWSLAQHERSLVTARSRGTQPGPTVGILRRQIEGIGEDFGDDDMADEAASDTIETATRLFHEPAPAERALLDEMRRRAEDARGWPDSKTRSLLN
jgi:hypothetical protein